MSIGRLLGDGERLLGHPEHARGYYAQALELCQRIRFRPEIALIRLAQAELLLAEAQALTRPQSPGGGFGGPLPEGEARGLPPLPLGEGGGEGWEQQRAEAREHLDFAIAEFRAMKMRPSLEGALEHRNALSA